MPDERNEALMRVVVGIISGIILGIWRALIQLLVIIHWITVLITGERQKSLAEFCHLWNLQIYAYLKYMTFVNNIRPFPFGDLISVKPEDIE